MINLDKLNTAAIVRHYALANTPRFLYRHLRAEPSVQELAESSTPTELLTAIDAIEANATRNAQDVAIAYAMLVAIGLQSYNRAEDALAHWQPRTLAWARDIVSIIKHTTIVTNVLQLKGQRGRIAFGLERNDAPFTTQELLQ